MNSRTMKVLVLLVASCVYWQLVCRSAGVSEPWDSDAYWRLWYPLSIGSAAIFGYLFRKHGWLAGSIITFAQFPIMWVNSGAALEIVVAVLFLFALAVPAVAISMVAGRYASRPRSL